MKKEDSIIVFLSGGLGNQMFQYAFGRYLSVKNNLPLKLDLSHLNDSAPRPGYVLRAFALEVFKIDGQIATKEDTPFLYRRYFSGKIARVVEAFRRKILNNPGKEKHFQFDQEIFSLTSGVYLEGYWQSPKYFKPIEEIIRNDFALKNPLPEKIQILVNEIKSCNSLGIFVRRQDYVGNAFHETVNGEYYDKALELILQKEKIEKIYIITDDKEWCKANMHFDIPYMVAEGYEGEHFVGEMMLLAACKHFIIPNSTFAWWGAWLSENKNKIIIAPKKWFGDPSINTDDVTPSEWVRI